MSNFLAAALLVLGFTPVRAGTYYSLQQGVDRATMSLTGPLNVTDPTVNTNTPTVQLSGANSSIGLGTVPAATEIIDILKPEAKIRVKSNGSSGNQHAVIETDNATTGGGSAFSESRWSVNGTAKGSMGVDHFDGDKLKIAGGINVNVSTYAVADSTGIAFCGPTPWTDIRCYGGKGDGVTNNDAAIAAALAVIPSTGGVLYFPGGIYLITNLTLTDKNITLLGNGGTGSWGNNSTDYRFATVIKSNTTTGPIIKWTTADRTFANDPYQYFVAMKDIAVIGNGTNTLSAKNAQDCIQVDQQGVNFQNVSATWCGGNGLSLTSSVSSNFYNFMSVKNNGSGVYLNDASVATTGSGVTDNNFFGLKSIANAEDGYHMARGQGTKCYGCLLQSNRGYAINMSGEACGGTVYINEVHFDGTWTEVDSFGALHISSNTRNSNFEFTHLGGSVTVDAGSYNTQYSAETDVSNGAYDSSAWTQFNSIRNGLGNSSGDISTTKVRNSVGTGYGNLVMDHIVLTNGIGDVKDTSGQPIVPSTVPTSGAINIANGKGIVSENAAANGSYTLIASNSGNGTSLAGNVSASSNFFVSLSSPTNQANASGAFVNQFWVNASTNTGGGYVAGSSDTVTLPIVGCYDVQCQITWKANSSGSVREINLLHLADRTAENNMSCPPIGGGTESECVARRTICTAAANETVKCRAYQDSGSSLYIDTDPTLTFFQVRLVQ